MLRASAEIQLSKPRKSNKKAKNTCRYCNKSFKLQIQLNLHLSKKHASKGMRCNKCSKNFHGLSRYADHVTYIHPDPTFVDPRKHQCKFCKARFYMSESLKTHFKYCLKTTAKCNFCNETFNNKMALKTHIFIHHMDLRFTDNQCPWCMTYVPFEHITYHILSSHTDSVEPATTNKYLSKNLK